VPDETIVVGLRELKHERLAQQGQGCTLAESCLLSPNICITIYNFVAIDARQKGLYITSKVIMSESLNL
jgi:hypothetical protein